jgi:hypothetical protein
MKFSQPNLHYEVASRDDPHPFLYELGQTAGSLSTAAGRLVRRRVKQVLRMNARGRTAIPAP